MAITVANILAAVNVALNRGETGIDNQIMEVLKDLAQRDDFLPGKATVTTVAGTAGYAVPTLYKSTEKVILDGEPLLKGTLESLATCRGTPTHYVVWNGYIYFSPIPGGVHAIDLYHYLFHSETLTTITFADQFRTAINEGCIAAVAESLQMYDDAMAHGRKYEAEILKLSGSKTNRQARFTRHNDL